MQLRSDSQSVSGAGYFIAVVALILALVRSPAVDATETGLTLPEAQRLAVAQSRQLAAQDSAVTAAREMAVAASQFPDPVATIGVNNLPVNGPDAWSFTQDFMTMRSVGVMQEFTRSEKREARAARYDREADKVLAEKDARIGSIQRDTALAWLDRFYAEAMVAVVTEQITQSGAEIDAADVAYRAGRANLADVVAARGALAALDDRASELRRRVTSSKIALARWIGDAAQQPLVGRPAIDTVRLDAHAVDEALENHPQIAVLTRQEAVAAAEVKVAQANKKADWSVALMYSQRGPAYSNMISLNVSVPLQWDQQRRQDREVAAKLAMLDQAREERADMLRAHVAEVRAMLAEWENDRERSTRYVREILPLASERTEATSAAFRSGKATITDVLIARRSEIDVRMQALQLEMETARLWAQLNFLAPDHAVGTQISANNRSARP